MKSARRILLVGAAAAAIYVVDRTGWPIFILLAVWVVLLVLGALVAERRGYPKPVADFMIFALLTTTMTALALQMMNFLWNREILFAAVLMIFIFILVKATLDFLDRPFPGAKKTSVVLSKANAPATEPRHEII